MSNMYFHLERKYLKSIGELIQRKDKRSIRKWCKNNHLQTYKDSSGEFVFSKDFELVYESPLLLKLKEKYRDDWIKYYEAYKRDGLYKLLDSDLSLNNQKSNYIPKGKFSSILRKSA